MRLKAFTKKGDPAFFDIADCPVYVSDTELALAHKRNSSILQAETVVRGDSSKKMFEGDYVCEGTDILGYVVYSKGFKMWNLQQGVKELPQSEHIYLKEGTIETCSFVQSVEGRTPVLLAYMGKLLQFNSLVCASKNGVRLNNTPGVVKTQDIQLYTGIADDVDSGVEE